jgi:hypothetical protein
MKVTVMMFTHVPIASWPSMAFPINICRPYAPRGPLGTCSLDSACGHLMNKLSFKTRYFGDLSITWSGGKSGSGSLTLTATMHGSFLERRWGSGEKFTKSWQLDSIRSRYTFQGGEPVFKELGKRRNNSLTWWIPKCSHVNLDIWYRA